MGEQPALARRLRRAPFVRFRQPMRYLVQDPVLARVEELARQLGDLQPQWAVTEGGAHSPAVFIAIAARVANGAGP